MKAYTDLEQSKKLSEILPIESADMYWLNRHIDLTETKYEVFIIDKSNKYIDFFNSYAVAVDNNEIIPCWSLAALLSVVSEVSLNSFKDGNWNAMVQRNDKAIYGDTDNPVDACYEMIIKLHELKLL